MPRARASSFIDMCECLCHTHRSLYVCRRALSLLYIYLYYTTTTMYVCCCIDTQIIYGNLYRNKSQNFTIAPFSAWALCHCMFCNKTINLSMTYYLISRQKNKYIKNFLGCCWCDAYLLQSDNIKINRFRAFISVAIPCINTTRGQNCLFLFGVARERIYGIFLRLSYTHNERKFFILWWHQKIYRSLKFNNKKERELKSEK